MITSMIILISIILSILTLLMMSFYKNHKIKLNSNSSFECGFNQKISSLMPFSSQFFLITILFLIFDLEIALFLPFILTESSKMNNNLINLTMMIILTVGLIKEWKEGMVEWSK